MKACYMMDTDCCIYLKKRQPPEVVKRFRQLRPGEVVISLITYGELYNGALKSRESAAAIQNLRLLAERLPVLSMCAGVAENYGLIRSQLEQQGNIIGNNDLWIAAHAVNLDLTLVTNNVREFSRVSGLRVENWLDEN